MARFYAFVRLRLPWARDSTLVARGMPAALRQDEATFDVLTDGVLNAAARLADLAASPGARLEKPKGDRSGQYSIRINEKYRVCFRFDAGNAYDVEIVDYHSGRAA